MFQESVFARNIGNADMYEVIHCCFVNCKFATYVYGSLTCCLPVLSLLNILIKIEYKYMATHLTTSGFLKYKPPNNEMQTVQMKIKLIIIV